MSVDSPDTSANGPVAATPAACCKWRTGLQIPLLLFAAGGLGFAGHQISQSPDFSSLLTGASQCPMSAGGCAAASPCTSTTGSCCSSEHVVAEADAVGEMSDVSAVSALAPANLVPAETELETYSVLKTL